MQCEEIAFELDAYATGELSSSRSADIERHLQQCFRCSNELAKIRKENALYKEYGAMVDIPSRSWLDSLLKTGKPSEDASAKTGRRFPSPLPQWLWAAAAAVLLAAGLSWYFLVHQNSHEFIATQKPGRPIGPVVSINQTFTAMEQAITVLQTSYEEKKHNLDPLLVKELDRNLELTDTAITECKQALKNNPGNDQVVEFLMFDYEKQLDILKQIKEEL